MEVWWNTLYYPVSKRFTLKRPALNYYGTINSLIDFIKDIGPETMEQFDMKLMSLDNNDEYKWMLRVTFWRDEEEEAWFKLVKERGCELPIEGDSIRDDIRRSWEKL